MVQQSFLSWKASKPRVKPAPSCIEGPGIVSEPVDSVAFTPRISQELKLKAVSKEPLRPSVRNHSSGRTSQLYSLSRILMSSSDFGEFKSAKHGRKEEHIWLHASPLADLDNILSMHKPLETEEVMYTNCLEFHAYN